MFLINKQAKCSEIVNQDAQQKQSAFKLKLDVAKFNTWTGPVPKLTHV